MTAKSFALLAAAIFAVVPKPNSSIYVRVLLDRPAMKWNSDINHKTHQPTATA